MADAPEVVPESWPAEKGAEGTNTMSSATMSPLGTVSSAEKTLSTKGIVSDDDLPEKVTPKDGRAGSGLEALGKEEKEIMSYSGEGNQPIEPDPPAFEETTRQRAIAREPTEEPSGDAQLPYGDQRLLVNKWKHSFWEFWKPGGDCVEVLFLPCVLAGRTHTRLHNPDSRHLPSINPFCLSCFGLGLFSAIGLPCYMIMTSAQRREIRYKYHIKGTNLEDCWKSTFFLWCALMQEEKEVLAQLDARDRERARTESTGQMRPRQDRMEYRS